MQNPFPKPEPPRTVFLREDELPIFEKWRNDDGTFEYCHPEAVARYKRLRKNIIFIVAFIGLILYNIYL